jgi:hypothetical protein
MRVSGSSVGDYSHKVSRIEGEKSCANRRCRRAKAVKADSGKPAEEPGTKPGSVQQEERTCPVCGTKFYAAESGFCPVCILRGATSEESTATGGAGSASE